MSACVHSNLVNVLPEVGDGITAKQQGWVFDESVAKTFTSHVTKSVPLYQEVQTLAVNMADWFVEDDSTIYDVGCSTGTTLRELYGRHKSKKNIQLIGIDNSSAMVDKAREGSKGLNPKILNFLCQDILEYDLPANIASAIYSLYSLQFTSLSKRRELCKKIHASLKEHGAFILVEKIIDSDYRVADMFTNLHCERKVEMGLKPEENYHKTQSLRGVLNPLTVEGNITLLKESGFSRVSTFFQWCNFVGFVAIK